MGYRKHVPVNKLGLSGGAGGFGIDLTDLLNDSDLDLKWVSGPFEPGDVLLFHSLTIVQLPASHIMSAHILNKLLVRDCIDLQMRSGINHNHHLGKLKI